MHQAAEKKPERDYKLKVPSVIPQYWNLKPRGTDGAYEPKLYPTPIGTVELMAFYTSE